MQDSSGKYSHHRRGGEEAPHTNPSPSTSTSRKPLAYSHVSLLRIRAVILARYSSGQSITQLAIGISPWNRNRRRRLWRLRGLIRVRRRIFRDSGLCFLGISFLSTGGSMGFLRISEKMESRRSDSFETKERQRHELWSTLSLSFHITQGRGVSLKKSNHQQTGKYCTSNSTVVPSMT